MKEKIKIGIEFLKKKIRLSVVFLTLLFGLLILAISYSYAFFTVQYEKQNTIQLVAGTFHYTLSGNSISSSGEINVSERGNTVVDVSLVSNNNIESAYQLVYQSVVRDGIHVFYYLGDDNSQPFGTIGTYSAEKKITIVIQNTTDTSSTIRLQVVGGLVGKDIELLPDMISVTEEIHSYAISTTNSQYGITTVKNQRTQESSTTGVFAFPNDTIEMSFQANDTYSHVATEIRASDGSILNTLDSNMTTFTVTEASTIHPSWKKEDLQILKLDQSSMSTWSMTLHEGSENIARYMPERYYLYFSFSDDMNSRYDMISDQNFLVNEYETLRFAGITYYATGPFTLTVALTYDRNQWLNSPAVSKYEVVTAPANSSFQYELDISERIGYQYPGVQILSNSQAFSLEIYDVIAIGKTFTP